MRRIIGAIIILTCLGILIHDAASGRMSVFRDVYNRHDLAERVVDHLNDRNVKGVVAALRRGADSNAVVRCEYSTLLFYAALEDQHICSEALIRFGADVNGRHGNWNMVPLHWAALQGHVRTAEVLVAHGADVNAKTDDGRTPLDLAMESLGRRWQTAEIAAAKNAIAALLRKHGGKTGKELDQGAGK